MIKKCYKYFQFVIRIYNENLKLLTTIQSKLSKLGVNAYIHRFGKKDETRKYKGKILVYNNDYYALEISNRKSVGLVLKELSLKYATKVEKANQILSLNLINLWKQNR